ncbi:MULTISPECIES: N-acetylmannosamine-6-phosphate 2-epimerase [Lactobacillaceae]|jgi:N-acylglucosamine-6-phosphate 2-epimerase|uniref:Putative N-acetylmannosamine-6-phosphate 2-epimerase n=5 Tax=Lactobacillaceae TaxID=33958 RepID=A0A2I0Z7P4_LACPE|nr:MULTISPECIES: N-acetylmannosamine-6-phosphate 2-epimerase [Lactobacillaceae]CCC17173.1 putative N-acetylmannosamine-6-phosphate 2-epimerase [Lactiplantibacillus pentosus IG1]BBM21841.1 N-acetylmannosamine-6-phosphate 2-epimerase [Lactiplantibacillus plantarum]ATO45081.1 N-acetylmannosamine-6-phosphate 2-epimerase [Loigolactobacillus coryniformis subsp. torquens DSM 20004 = KCTC 3535]AYG38757.1 N-acetylmannosamine-6-phosphate 2-epimerase [Lactiplantibacillus pentosus]AYG41417.1 N-acetylmanno
MKNTFLDQVKGSLIISCQALPDEPLHSSFIMSRMALAAKEAGAAGIRANSIVDIQAIQDEVDLPVIGLNKVDYPDSPVYITPTIKEMRAVAATGCAAVACDVTGQPRPNGEKLADIVATMRAEFPDTLLMADTDTLENVRLADELGFDIIGTTMHGYTPATKGANIADDDFAYLKAVLKTTSHPVIAEGKVDTPAKMKRCLDLGCHAVVVGGAITRPLQIAKNFIDAL